MAGAASAHQAATATREQSSQQRADRTRRTSADPQRAQQGATAAAAAAPAALDSLSRLQQLADASPQVAQLRRLQALADGQFAPVAQLAGGPEEEELVQGKFSTAQRQPQLQQAPRVNNTGLPDQLKSGIESLSGVSMDHVRVHYNSAQPAQLNALAYAQGRDIHLAPGQERHLPHEAWHVVQQAQGRVKPTLQMKEGVRVNDDVGLEREADVMGSKALEDGHRADELDRSVSMPVETAQPIAGDTTNSLDVNVANNDSAPLANGGGSAHRGGSELQRMADQRPEAALQRQAQAWRDGSERGVQFWAWQEVADGRGVGGKRQDLTPSLRKKENLRQSAVRREDDPVAEGPAGFVDRRTHPPIKSKLTNLSCGPGLDRLNVYRDLAQDSSRVSQLMTMHAMMDDRVAVPEKKANVKGGKAERGDRVGGEKDLTDLSIGSGENVAQCYSLVVGSTRYSENHLFMLINSKSLWVRQTALDHSNQVLDTKNSFVKLIKTGLSIESAFGATLFEIKPAWNQDRETKIPETQRLKRANEDVDGYTTHADCFMNAQTVMGVEDTSTGSRNQTAPIFMQDGARAKRAPVTPFPAGPGSALSSNAPTRGYLAFLDYAMPLFYKTLDTNGVRTADESDFLEKYRRTSLPGFRYAYRMLSTVPRYADLLDAFSQQFGVNNYMAPEIGEGLAVVNHPEERNEMQNAIEKGQRNPDKELWNYHFAGVVMKDGDDYVTLENYSVGNDLTDNQQWLFQVYGSGNQSFHAELLGKPGIGAASLSLGYAQNQ
jgi:hypothetical protein